MEQLIKILHRTMINLTKNTEHSLWWNKTEFIVWNIMQHNAIIVHSILHLNAHLLIIYYSIDDIVIRPITVNKRHSLVWMIGR